MFTKTSAALGLAAAATAAGTLLSGSPASAQVLPSAAPPAAVRIQAPAQAPTGTSIVYNDGDWRFRHFRHHRFHHFRHHFRHHRFHHFRHHRFHHFNRPFVHTGFRHPFVGSFGGGFNRGFGGGFNGGFNSNLNVLRNDVSVGVQNSNTNVAVAHGG